MNQAISEKDLNVFIKSFGDHQRLGDWVNDAIHHYFIKLSKNDGRDRFDGLSPYRILFAQFEAPVEWLEAIWDSALQSSPTAQRKVRNAIEYAILALPTLQVNEPIPEQTQWSAMSFAQLVRRKRIGELLRPFEARLCSNKKTSWCRDEGILFEVLGALYACAEHPRARDLGTALMQKRFFDDPRLSRKHLAVFFVSFAKCFIGDGAEFDSANVSTSGEKSAGLQGYPRPRGTRVIDPFVEECNELETFVREQRTQWLKEPMGSLSTEAEGELLASSLIRESTEDYLKIYVDLPNCRRAFLPPRADEVIADAQRGLSLLSTRT